MCNSIRIAIPVRAKHGCARFPRTAQLVAAQSMLSASGGEHVWRHAGDALINYNKLRIARADHSLSIDKACHVNRDPAAVHEHEIRVPDQPEMARPVSLDEELLRMPPKSEHFPVTRLELLHVHFRLARALHLRLA